MKKCEICREEYNDDVKVCTNCGYKFPDVAPAAPKAPATPKAPQAPVTPQATQSQQTTQTAQAAQPAQGQTSQSNETTGTAQANPYASTYNAGGTTYTTNPGGTATYTTQQTGGNGPANAAHKLGWFKFYSLPLVILMIIGYALSLFRFIGSNESIVNALLGYLSTTATILTVVTLVANIALLVITFIMVFTLHKFNPLGYKMNIIFLTAYPVYCILNMAYTTLSSGLLFNNFFVMAITIGFGITLVLACVFSVLNLIYFQKRKYMFFGEAPTQYQAKRILWPLVIIGVCSIIAIVGSVIGLKADHDTYNSYYDSYTDGYDYDDDYDYDYDDDYDSDLDDYFDDHAEVERKTIPGATASQQEALETAYDYLDAMYFSRAGLIGQLEFEGYSTEDATFAVDNCGADWNVQAAGCAEDYLDYKSYTRSELIEQLLFEEFTQEEAEYGATAAGL